MASLKIAVPAGYSTLFEESEGCENSAWWLVSPDGTKTPLSLEISEEGVWYVNHCVTHADGKITLRMLKETLRQATAVKAFEAEAARMAKQAAAVKPVEA